MAPVNHPACKKLMLLGGAESVPASARLIGDDETLAVLGRYALEQVPQPEAAAALRDAAKRAAALPKAVP